MSYQFRLLTEQERQRMLADHIAGYERALFSAMLDRQRVVAEMAAAPEKTQELQAILDGVDKEIQRCTAYLSSVALSPAEIAGLSALRSQ